VCGIAGFLAPGGVRADPDLLTRMVGALRHRGPDAVGYHVEDNVALGVARLRVVDLVHGDQPLANEDGTVHVVLNGEIYNFRNLRERLRARGHRFTSAGDTEVIAHAWEEEGEGCLDAFNGMFALALWDRARRLLFLARDRMGEKPLYWTDAGGWLVFASELRALLAHPAVSRELDPAGVARYLAYDYVPDPHAILRGVQKLPPAHVLVATDGKRRVQRYWEIPFAPDPSPSEASWCARIAAGLDAAVARRLEADVPLGCFLSGGIDSTAIAATAARARPGIATFSIGFAEALYDEGRFARLVAERIGAHHEELVMTATDAAAVLERLGELLDEPIADMSFVPLYLLSRAARARVTVALTGDGGDELFAGYPSMGAAWWQGAFGRLPRRVREALALAADRVPFTPPPLRDFLHALGYRPSVRNQVLIGGLPPARHAGLLSAEMRSALAAFDPYDDIEHALQGCVTDDPVGRLIHGYCKLYLAGQNLANADRASMAVGLELRAPFLDHEFVALTGRIPSRLKLRGLGALKQLLKRALADRLPPEVLRRGKHGFTVPFGEWFRGPLAPVLRDTLATEHVRAGGIFDPAAVSRLVDEHVSGRRNHGKLLWSLFVFERWRAAQLG
jgi:asparagine synthase (glutamine-hydrolysing)